MLAWLQCAHITRGGFDACAALVLCTLRLCPRRRCDQDGAGQLGQCSYPPSQLCEALMKQEGGFAAGNNNEIVVDTSSVEADPANMIAGFFMGGQHDDDVRAAYRAFIHRYGLDPERAPPLMRMDLEGEEAFILED